MSAEDRQEIEALVRETTRTAIVEAARDGLLGPEAQEAANGSRHHSIAPV